MAITNLGAQWMAGATYCVFIEPDRQRYEHLVETTRKYMDKDKLVLQVLNTTFEDGMHQLKSQMPNHFQGTHPMFVFIDPFGATGVPFSVVTDILNSQAPEVLINLDVDGITRNVRAKQTDVLDRVFGDDTWQSLLDEPVFSRQCRKLLALYIARLRSLPDIKYVFAFEMRSKGSNTGYYLVFASKHPLGLEKMKEAMAQIDKTKGYSFSDANVHQPTLMRFDDVPYYSDQLREHFINRTVSYAEVRDYALNETPFTNPKSMLKDLETNGHIQVASTNPRRRKGSFPEETIRSITF